MSSWSTMRMRITASVRTTSRMNALLSESMNNKRKAMHKMPTIEVEDQPNDAEKSKPSTELVFFRNNFSMERVHKLIETAIEERLMWDRLSRTYDSWRALQLAENLSADIRDRVKRLKHRSHRIVCILSVIERQNQGLSLRMRHFLDPKLDNFTNFVYERPSYTIVVTLFLVNKD